MRYGSTMALILFSDVHGTVLQHGQPVAHARVVREYRWSWKEQTGVDEATTDAQGRFHFPAIVGRSFGARWLPHEPLVRQTITVAFAGEPHRVWVHDKANYRANGELGEPIVLTCRLEAGAP